MDNRQANTQGYKIFNNLFNTSLTIERDIVLFCRALFHACNLKSNIRVCNVNFIYSLMNAAFLFKLCHDI